MPQPNPQKSYLAPSPPHKASPYPAPPRPAHNLEINILTNLKKQKIKNTNIYIRLFSIYNKGQQNQSLPHPTDLEKDA